MSKSRNQQPATSVAESANQVNPYLPLLSASTSDSVSLLSTAEQTALSLPEHGWPKLLETISALKVDADVVKYMARAMTVSPNPVMRRFAAEGLSVWRPHEEQSLSLLRWLATDRDPTVSKAAAKAIGELGSFDQKAWEEIEELTKNASTKARVVAARACAHTKKSLVLRLLQNLAADPDDEVRVAAAEAWHRALLDWREKAWPAFTEMANDADWQKRHTVALTLLSAARELKPEELILLNQLLGDEASEVRIAALRVLAEIPGELSVPAQQMILAWANGEKDPFDWEEREAAIPGLAHLSRWQASKALPVIERLANDGNMRIAAAAAQVMGQLAHKFPDWASPTIEMVTASGDEFSATLKRQACSRGLALAEPPYSTLVFPMLEKFFNDRDEEVRAEAVRCLKRFAHHHPDQVMELLSRLARSGNDPAKWEIRRTVANALREVVVTLPSRVLPLLERLAADSNGNVRMAVAEGFKKAARIEPEKTLFSMIQLAEDHLPEKRQTAAVVLAEIAPSYPDKALQMLKRLAAESDANVRDAAAFSLGQIAHRFPQQLVPSLQRIMQNRKGQSVLKMTQGLSDSANGFSPQIVPLLKTLVEDKDLEIQQAAAQTVVSLTRWMPDKALEFSDNWGNGKKQHLRAARLNILGIAAFCRNTKAVEALKNLSASEDEEARADAARVWGELRFVQKKDSLAFLYQAAEDEDWVVREAAGLALGARGWLKPKNITRSLNDLANDQELIVAFAANAIWDSLRLGDYSDGVNAENGELVLNGLLGNSRFARYQQTRLGSYLISIIAPPGGIEEQNGGFRVQRLPGEFALPATIDLLLDDLDVVETRQPSSALPVLMEEIHQRPDQQIFKKIFTWLGRKILGDEVELTFLKTAQPEKEQPVLPESPSRPIGLNMPDLHKRLHKLITNYSETGSYSLKEIERLVQVLPRPLVFYALYRSARSVSARRVARLGYDLASLVEKVETADLLKGTTQTELRGQLPKALDDFLHRCSRLEDDQKDIYVERFSWMREALTVTSLEQIPLLLASPIQKLTNSGRNAEWLERCRHALLEATGPLKELDANTTADTKTFLLLRCIIGLEAATRTVSAESREPDRTILLQAVTAWRELISDESQRSQSGAHLEIIVPQRVPAGGQIELTIKIINHGPSSVAKLRLEVTGDGPSFQVESNPLLVLASLAVGQSHTFTVLAKAWTKTFRVKCILQYDEPRRLGLVLHHSVDVTTESLATSEVWKDIRNPFVAGIPLKPEFHSHLFVGRAEIFNFLHKQLINTETPRPVLLHGRRRMGKSSVLMWLPTKLPPEYHAAYVDLQGAAVAEGSAQHLQYVANTILRTLPGQAAPEATDLKAFEANPANQFNEVFLPELKRMLNGKKLVVTFDEFQALEDKINDGKLEVRFTSFLRGWVMKGDACFVFVGTRSAKDFDTRIWSDLFMLAVAREIDLLSTQESLQVMKAPLVSAGVDYDDPSLEHLKWLTGNHPYFVQWLCSEVVDELNRRRQKLVNVSTVDAAAKQLIEGAAVQLRFLWDEMEDEQRAVIGSIYEQLSLQSDDKQCRMEDVWRWMNTVNPKVPQGDFQRIIRSLERRGSVKDDSGTLRFSLGLLPAFLAEYVPARETKERIFKLW